MLHKSFAASQASASFILGNVIYRREILTERFKHGCAILPSYRSIVLLSCEDREEKENKAEEKEKENRHRERIIIRKV